MSDYNSYSALSSVDDDDLKGDDNPSFDTNQTAANDVIDDDVPYRSSSIIIICSNMDCWYGCNDVSSYYTNGGVL